MNVLLVITDERSIGESLRAALPETDLLLSETSLDKALRRLVALKVDALLVDETPNLTTSALSRLMEAAPATPVVLLSNRSDAESLARWTLAGVRACVVKPFSCEALCEAVEKVTRRKENGGDVEGSSSRSSARSAGVAQESAARQAQMVLRWLSRTVHYGADAVRLSQGLVDTVTDAFDTIRAAVLLETDGYVRVTASAGLPPSVAEALRLTFSAGLMRWLEENTCLFDRLAHRESVGAAKEMQLLGARMAVPFLIEGRVCGALVVGEKASGLDYGTEERDLLTVMGRCASGAFERCRAQNEAAIHQTRLDGVFAHLPAGVVVVLPDRTVAMVSPEAERLLNVRAMDVVGRSVQKLSSGLADVALRTLADGQARLRQEIREPAVKAVFRVDATPIGDAGEAGADGVVMLFAKVPEEAASKDDVAHSPFWEYLSGRVAQEIKNPMVAINTYAHLLPRKYDSQDFREAFSRVMQKEVARINNVIETLFAFARQPELLLRRSDVNETVRAILRGFEDELAERAIKLETEWDAAMTVAELDVVHFSQAIHNVVQNSIDAMPAGGVLKVSTKKIAEACQITVADTGPGVAADQAPLIFLPFYSTKVHGMGLGLPTAKRILQQHAGDVRLLENPKGGGTFAISVPTAKDSV